MGSVVQLGGGCYGGSGAVEGKPKQQRRMRRGGEARTRTHRAKAGASNVGPEHGPEASDVLRTATGTPMLVCEGRGAGALVGL